MNINRGKAFMVCGMGGCSIALDFFACISSIIAAYRFSVKLDIALYRRCIFITGAYSKIRVCYHRVRQSAKQLLSAMVRVGR